MRNNLLTWIPIIGIIIGIYILVKEDRGPEFMPKMFDSSSLYMACHGFFHSIFIMLLFYVIS